MYEVSVPGSTSSGRTSSPSYGPIQVPSGIVCLAQTPYPAPGIPDTHRPTSFGNNSTAFGNLMALLFMLLLLFTVFVSLNDWWGLCNWHCSVRSWWHPLHPREEKRGLIFAKLLLLTSVSVASLIIQFLFGCLSNELECLYSLLCRVISRNRY